MTAPLESLPKEIATELRWAAWNAAWHAANTRMGTQAAAVGDELRWRRHIANFARLTSGQSINRITARVRDFLWSAAWCTANLRSGNQDEAAREQASANVALADIRKSGQFSKGLSDLIDGLAWGAAWHAANSLKGKCEDAQADLLRFEDCYRRMMGQVRVEGVTLQADHTAVSWLSALITAGRQLQNPTSVPQPNKFTFQVAQSTTTGAATRVGLEISAGMKTRVGLRLTGADLFRGDCDQHQEFLRCFFLGAHTNSDAKA
jgi:hypothetical protein